MAPAGRAAHRAASRRQQPPRTSPTLHGGPMRTRTLLGLAAPVALVAALAAATTAPTMSADEAAIRQTVQLYFDGGAKLNEAFHSDARMLYVKEGKFQLVPI